MRALAALLLALLLAAHQGGAASAGPPPPRRPPPLSASTAAVTIKVTAVQELNLLNVLPTWGVDAALKSAIPVEPTGLRYVCPLPLAKCGGCSHLGGSCSVTSSPSGLLGWAVPHLIPAAPHPELCAVPTTGWCTEPPSSTLRLSWHACS
jgi:hypothetical protein